MGSNIYVRVTKSDGFCCYFSKRSISAFEDPLKKAMEYVTRNNFKGVVVDYKDLNQAYYFKGREWITYFSN